MLADSAPRASGRDRIGKKDPPYDETFVMPENLFSAAGLTGNPAFTDLAHRYLLDRELFDPLAHGDDPFPGQHAYSHAIALSSAERAPTSSSATPNTRPPWMQNAFTLLTTTQQFASGGWGPNETFITPHRGELYASLTTTVDHFETPCGSYAATKLARYLMRIRLYRRKMRQPQYADNLERVLYNTILAVKIPRLRRRLSLLLHLLAATQRKSSTQKKWPCCSGTLAQTVADYPLNIYFQSPKDGLYVNLYAPSRLEIHPLRSSPITLTQETSYPASDTVDPHPQSGHPNTPSPSTSASLRGLKSASLDYQRQAAEHFPLQPGDLRRPSRRTWKSGDRDRPSPSRKLSAPSPSTTRTPTPSPSCAARCSTSPSTPSSTTIAQRSLPFPSGLKQIAPTGLRRRLLRPADRLCAPLHQVQIETYTTYFSTAYSKHPRCRSE